MRLEELDSTRWRRFVHASVARSWPRSHPLALAAVVASCLAFSALLVAVRYPAWRIIAFTCVGLCGVVPYALGRLDARFWPEWAGDEQFPLTVLLLGCLFTGGLHSPVIVSTLGPITRTVRGRSIAPRTVLRVVGFALAVGVLAVAPQSWVGPRLPDTAYLASMFGFLLLWMLLHAHYASAIAETLEAMIRQLFHAREEAAARALARARELEVLSSKLSHELKNPLGAVKALVQLSARTAVDAPTRERLGRVESEVERMQAILQEYLSFSRPLDIVRPEPVELGALVDDVLAALEGRAHAADVLLERRGDVLASADPGRLKEALLNLVANSIEATPPGGRVSVRLSERAGAIEVAVCDTGQGMSQEVLAHLGAPFFTTRPQGTGLGVLLARGVFTQHGGSLEYESVPGQGTVAVGRLPGIIEEGPRGVRAAGR